MAATWWLEYVRARGSLAAADDRRPQVITPGERPTRMILAGVGLGLPSLALAALWGQVVIVGRLGPVPVRRGRCAGWRSRRPATGLDPEQDRERDQGEAEQVVLDGDVERAPASR